jgi:MFS family permease
VRLRDWIGALSERNFRLFFVGQATSQIGSGMAPVAITFAVLEHGNASDLGLVSAAGLVPVVVLLLVGGVIADRWSRRLVMLNSDLLRTLAEVGLGAWILLGRPPLWGFMSLAAVVGVGSSIFYPAMNGLIPQVISKANLQQGNALQSLSGSVAGVIGPALAGVIIAVSSPGWAVLIDGLTYLVSVLSLFMLSIEWIPKAVAESFLTELKQGWSEFWGRTWLWVIVVEFSIVNVLESAPFFVLGPVIAKQSLGGAPAWGGVLAAGGAGAVLGGIVMLRWNSPRPLLTATVASVTFALPLFALADRAPVLLVGAAVFVGGVGSAVFGTLWATTMQREIPSAVLSRVSAYDMFGSLLFLPIGMAVVGPISKVLGDGETLAGSSLLLIALVIATLCVPSVTRMRAPARSGQISDSATTGGTIDRR